MRKLIIVFTVLVALIGAGNRVANKAASVGGGGGGSLAFDAVSTGSAAADTITVAHTNGSLTNGYAVVKFYVDYWDVVIVSSVTFNGSSLSQIGTTDADGMPVYIYGGTIGTLGAGAHNAVVNLSTTVYDLAVVVETYTGVNQTTPTGTAVIDHGFNAAATCSVGSASGELVIDVVANKNQTDTWTPNGSQTSRAAYTAINKKIFSSTKPGATTTVMSWTAVTGGDYAQIAIALKP